MNNNIIEKLEPGDEIEFLGESNIIPIPDEPVKVKKKSERTPPDNSKYKYVRVGGGPAGRGYKLIELSGKENTVRIVTGSPPGEFIEIKKV